MRSFPRLGAVNAALVSLYFSPVWGIEAVRALTSPYYGLEDRAQAVAATISTRTSISAWMVSCARRRRWPASSW